MCPGKTLTSSQGSSVMYKVRKLNWTLSWAPLHSTLHSVCVSIYKDKKDKLPYFSRLTLPIWSKGPVGGCWPMSSSWPFPQESHFLNEVFIVMTTTHFSVAQHLSISPCFEDPMCPFHRVLGALIILEPIPHGGSFTHQALALLTSLAVQVQT